MPGGWHFLQKMPDGTEVKIESDQYKNLVPDVLNFRLHNRLPIGDPPREVDEQICTRFPQQCQMGVDPGGYVRRPIPPGPPRFIDQIIMWAQSLLGNQGIAELEIQQEAERRAAICVQCPLNIDWKQSCPSCVSHAETLMTLIRKGRNVTQWRKLHACRALGQDNATAVWIKKELLQRGPTDHLPGHCWAK